MQDLRHLALNQERAQAHSVALIMAEMSEDFPPAGGRALEVVSTVEAAPMGVVVTIGDRIYLHMELANNSRIE